MCVNISDSDWNCKMLNGLCKFKCKPKGMEACLHFRGATLNARPAGVFWLLEEEILHKERRDFVRRQNRGVRKICRGRKTKVSRPIFFHILAEGGDVIDRRIVDIMLELAEA